MCVYIAVVMASFIQSLRLILMRKRIRATKCFIDTLCSASNKDKV